MLFQTIAVLSLTGSSLFLLFILLTCLLKKSLKMTWLYYGLLILSLFWIIPVWMLVPAWPSLAPSIMPVHPMNSAANTEIIMQSSELTKLLYTFNWSWIGLLYSFLVLLLLVRFVFQYIKQYKMLIQGGHV